LIRDLYAAQRFVSLLQEDAAILGTLERRPPADPEATPSRSRASDAGAAFAAELRQRS